jgi:hypothetical protein
MNRRLFLLVLAALVVACLVVPSAALAQSKISPNIRGVRSAYVTTVATPIVTISGRLLYRKLVVRSHKKVKVDAPIPGHINLYRRNDNSYRWDRVDTSRLVGGAFSFDVARSGNYLVRFVGAKGIKAREVYTTVEADLISITNLHAISASVLPTSGDLFVRVGADIDAPAGVITTATPAFGLMYFRDAGDSTGQAILLGAPFAAVAEQVIRNVGPYQAGFTIPVGDKDRVLQLSCTILPLNRWVAGHSVTATFTPSDLLP